MVCMAATAAFAGCTQAGGDTSAADGTHAKVSEMPPSFDPRTAVITEKTVPVYREVPENYENKSIYFINGGDIPYISLEEFMFVLEDAYNLTFEADGGKASYVRENGYSADFDFGKNTIHFTDFNMFNQMDEASLIDVSGISDRVAPLFQKDEERSYERYGREITMHLSEYGITMLHRNGGYYIPLQTFSDIFISGLGCGSLYNGEAIIIASGLDDEMSEIYYSAPKSERSKEFALFDYNELCFALDHHYGLKDTHRITNFDAFFTECGYDKVMKGTNQTLADAALYEFITLHLDDRHSGFAGVSFRTDKDLFKEETAGITTGSSTRIVRETQKEFQNARSKYFPDGIVPYEEVGNTAYITFDNLMNGNARDFYSKPKEEEFGSTIRLLQYAFDRITREGSPVENVVMDLSLNGGGIAYIAVYATGMFTGEGQVSVSDELTGALTSQYYRLDTNRDHVFDEKDTLAGKGYKFYCLESVATFSCGNLVTNVFKNSNKVTLIGQTSGGGSCIVQHMSTAGGTSFQISGDMRMSFIKNGAFYDIDRGAEPDVYIKDPEFLYDRKALTDYINNNIK